MRAAGKPDASSSDDKPRDRKRNKFLRIFKRNKEIESQAQQSNSSLVHIPQTTLGGILLTSLQENPGQGKPPKPTPDLQTLPKPSSPTPKPIASVPQTTEVEPTASKEDANKCQDLWGQAYNLLKQRDGDLVTAYKDHLTSCKRVPTTAADSLLTSESAVGQLLVNRESKQWRLPWLGVDVKVREQLEKLVKFALWSDTIVQQALAAQPHVALAWSAVSILLPVS